MKGSQTPEANEAHQGAPHCLVSTPRDIVARSLQLSGPPLMLLGAQVGKGEGVGGGQVAR